MTTTVTASKLRRRVTIAERQDGLDSSGGLLINWQAIASNVPANIVYPPPSKKGDETFTYQQVHSSVFTTITIRYRPSLNISPAMRVWYGSRIFEIRTVLNDDEARKYIIMQCEEIQNTGDMH